jgi:hypothetical protein
MTHPLIVTASGDWACQMSPEAVMAALGEGLDWGGKANFESRGPQPWHLTIECLVKTANGSVSLHSERSFSLVHRYVIHAQMRISPTGMGVGMNRPGFAGGCLV